MSEPTLTTGQRADVSISAHRQRLKVLFEENESRIAPDTALRSALLDADRFADEYVAEHRAIAPKPSLSEPTKEQYAKARAWFDTRRGSLLPPSQQAAAFVAAETAPLHEKIASLENENFRLFKWNSFKAAEVDELREKLAAALAPSAQTQQGLSEDEVSRAATLAEQKRWLDALDGACPNCLRGAAWGFPEDAPDCRECGTAVRDLCSAPPPTSSHEKQPSPAAAPAQLSEDGSGERILTLETALREMLKGPPWSSTHEAEARAMADAALAGQPAPLSEGQTPPRGRARMHAEQDQKALRAAAPEEQHDPVKVARILELAAATDCGNHWNSDGDSCADEACLHCRAGEMLPELRCRCGRFSLDRSTPSLWEGGATPTPINHAPDECAPPAPAKHCPTCAQTVPDARALAGSPAQQGQLTKEGAK